MNVLFLSPHFPPGYHHFCAGLRARGARVLGLGDVPEGALAAEVRDALDDYAGVRRLDDDEAVLRATASLVARHGRIDWLDSLNEHWLEVEARLRLDFNVPGPKPQTVARWRSKLAMARAFADAGLSPPPCVPAHDAAAVRALAAERGLPLVLKPDRGVGAGDAFVVGSAAELDAVAAAPPEGFVAQPYVEGTLTSFDGIVDGDGRVVYASSFVYSSGVLEIVRDQRDVCYYTRRVIPPALEAAGRAMVRAYDLRRRFFHAELFETKEGAYVPLELNARPPGGFSTHLMNYAADVDVYRLWAGAVTHEDLSAFAYERAYHAAHLSRRPGRAYVRSHEEVVRALGGALLFWADLPPVIAHAMGTPVYVVRDPSEARLLELAAMALERAPGPLS